MLSCNQHTIPYSVLNFGIVTGIAAGIINHQ